MKKIIKQVSKEIVQITTPDERWYVKTDEKGNTLFVPSVTWIAGFYPKGIGFYKWLATKGWNEAEALKTAAGDKGSKVHQAITGLIDGEIVNMDTQITNHSTEKEEELSLEEYEAIISFVDWFKETKPKVMVRDYVVFNDTFNYAGTTDLICEIKGELWLIDFKTSQYVWPEFEIQIAAYKEALLNKTILDPLDKTFITVTDKLKLGILQLGYGRNKKGFKFTEIADKFQLFMAAREIWKNEASTQQPFQKDYPISLILPVDCPTCKGKGEVFTQGANPDDIQKEICPNCKGDGKCAAPVVEKTPKPIA